MVTMEVILSVIALFALYSALGEAIDQNLYRIHQAETMNLFAQLFTQGMRVLGWILLVNFVALLLADRIWTFYVNCILDSLMTLMSASQRLDFSEKKGIRCNHDVLAQALAWRHSEYCRINELRENIRVLPSLLPASEKERAAASAGLKKVLDVLPRPSPCRGQGA